MLDKFYVGQAVTVNAFGNPKMKGLIQRVYENCYWVKVNWEYNTYLIIREENEITASEELQIRRPGSFRVIPPARGVSEYRIPTITATQGVPEYLSDEHCATLNGRLAEISQAAFPANDVINFSAGELTINCGMPPYVGDRINIRFHGSV